MRTIITLTFLAALYVCGVRAQSEACLEATEAALKFRDYHLDLARNEDQYNEYGSDTANRIIKDGVRFFDINLQSDQEIQKIVCGVIDAREKTIPAIASDTNSDVRRLAFLYSALVGFVQASLDPRDVDYYGPQVKFYDATGFPSFPLKISNSQLAEMVLQMRDMDLANMFWRYQAWNETQDQYSFNREKFLKDLTSASTLEEFVRASLDDPENSDPAYAQAGIRKKVQITVNEIERAYELYRAAKEKLHQTETFHGALKKAGFLGVTRGGPELYSCDFIADTAVEALGLAVEIFGRDFIMIERAMGEYLNLSVDDTEAVRALVCEIADSKTQKELMEFVPKEFLGSSPTAEMWYWQTSSTVQAILTGSYLGSGMEQLRMVSYMDTLHFPLSRDDARQFVSLIAARWHYYDIDEESFVNVFMGADSLDDAVSQAGDSWVLHSVRSWHRRFGGKTDLIVKLATRAYELTMSLEEIGLLMLPAN